MKKHKTLIFIIAIIITIAVLIYIFRKKIFKDPAFTPGTEEIITDNKIQIRETLAGTIDYITPGLNLVNHVPYEHNGAQQVVANMHRIQLNNATAIPVGAVIHIDSSKSNNPVNTWDGYYRVEYVERASNNNIVVQTNSKNFGVPVSDLRGKAIRVLVVNPEDEAKIGSTIY